MASFTLFAQTNKYTISGYVSDASNGEKLINATIYESAKFQGTVSNSYGFYSLTLSEGEYDIVFSYVGFETRKMKIKLDSDKKINVSLKYKTELEEVTIVAESANNRLKNSQMSKETISMEAISKLPAFLGEADVMKALQLMPGVQSGSEGNSGIYVRGGGADQNLILLDGVPVYNANHLFGFFSVFNTDAINTFSIYKGGFPARFGGRLSSVIDIRMKEGNEKEFKGGFQIGNISAKAYVEGPIVKDKTAFHISARRTYIDALMQPFLDEEEKGGYFFYDLNAKVNHKFSDKSRLYLSAYMGRDKAYSDYSEENSGDDDYIKDNSSLYWGNITTALRWNYMFNNKLFSNTTITYSDYTFRVGSKFWEYSNNKLNEFTEYKYNSGINDWSAKINFDWYPSVKHSVKFGINYIYHTFRPGVETLKMKEDNNDAYKKIGNKNIYTTEINTFIEDNFSVTPFLKANLGLHYSVFKVDDKFYSSLEPRSSLSFLVSDDFSVKASYARMQQYLHLLSNSNIGLPTDLWLPVTKKVKPQSSEQFALGLFFKPKYGYNISVEGYYKNMNNLLGYKEGASFLGTAEGWENKVEMGKGYSKGVEFMVQKNKGKLTGWIGYTWSKTEHKFPHVNQGEWFPARYDRTHDISVVLTQKLSKKVDFGATWVYGTGNATTLATHDIKILNVDYYGRSAPSYPEFHEKASYFQDKNNYRMPAYHRLDVGFSFHKKKKHGVRTWKLSVYNVYNRKNPFFIRTEEKDSGKKVLKQISIFPILPSISYSYKF